MESDDKPDSPSISPNGSEDEEELQLNYAATSASIPRILGQELVNFMKNWSEIVLE